MAASEDKAAVNSLLCAVFLLITSQVQQQVEVQQVDSTQGFVNHDGSRVLLQFSSKTAKNVY